MKAKAIWSHSNHVSRIIPYFWTAAARYTPIFEELGGHAAVTKYSAGGALPVTRPPAALHLDAWKLHKKIMKNPELQ